MVLGIHSRHGVQKIQKQMGCWQDDQLNRTAKSSALSAASQTATKTLLFAGVALTITGLTASIFVILPAIIATGVTFGTGHLKWAKFCAAVVAANITGVALLPKLGEFCSSRLEQGSQGVGALTSMHPTIAEAMRENRILSPSEAAGVLKQTNLREKTQ